MQVDEASWESYKKTLLDAARLNFPGYYATATERDRDLIDALVLCRAALGVGINAPRHPLPAAVRVEVERTTDTTEQAFTGLREAVRASTTFRAVSIGEQIQIERVLFSVSQIG